MQQSRSDRNTLFLKPCIQPVAYYSVCANDYHYIIIIIIIIIIIPQEYPYSTGY